MLFVASGLMHFLTPDRFASIVPPALPRPYLLVAISGAAEIAGAVGLMLPATRRLAAWCLMALLVAVFPANLHMLHTAHASQQPLWWQTLLALRLPLQPVLIWLTWRAGHVASTSRHGRS
jgi:uncharacterized membrane protein